MMLDPEYVKVTIVVEDSTTKRTMQFDVVRKPAMEVAYDIITLQQDYVFTFEAFGDKDGVVCTRTDEEKIPALKEEETND